MQETDANRNQDGNKTMRGHLKLASTRTSFNSLRQQPPTIAPPTQQGRGTTGTMPTNTTPAPSVEVSTTTAPASPRRPTDYTPMSEVKEQQKQPETQKPEPVVTTTVSKPDRPDKPKNSSFSWEVEDIKKR